MTRIMKMFAAVILWWLFYLPLNAFIILVYFKQTFKGKVDSSTLVENDCISDDQRIKYIVEKNLTRYQGISVNEGMGTRYERMMVDRLLLTLTRKYGVSSVLEAPADGITGVPGANSLCLARLSDTPVRLANPSLTLLLKARETWLSMGIGERVEVMVASLPLLPYQDQSFDMVWSFCMLEQMLDHQAYLNEVARVSRKLVLMVTVNDNAGLELHKKWHRKLNKSWDHGRVVLMTPTGLRLAMEKAGLEVLEIGGVDAPPSMDSSDMPLTKDIETLTGLFGMRWNWKLKDHRSEGQSVLNIFAWLEGNMPDSFRIRHAHHLYVVGRPKNRQGGVNG